MIKESDHNTINAALNICWEGTNKVTYTEVYNFNDTEGIKSSKSLRRKQIACLKYLTQIKI